VHDYRGLTGYVCSW